MIFLSLEPWEKNENNSAKKDSLRKRLFKFWGNSTGVYKSDQKLSIFTLKIVKQFQVFSKIDKKAKYFF